MLVSIINMKLRDDFESFEDLISYYDIDFNKISEKLKSNSYIYDEKNNKLNFNSLK